MKNDRIDLRIPTATKDRWKREAEKRKLKLTAMITQYVERGLTKK